MRVLFVIIGFVGLLLTGLVAFEIHAANDYRSNVQEVQSQLAQEGRREVAEAHRMGAVFTGQTLEDTLSPQLDGFDKLRNGWFVVAACSVTLMFVGVAGILLERKLHAQTVSGWEGEIRQKNNVGLMVVAAILALASWPLLFVGLVWKFQGEEAPPASVLFLSWVASGLFWGFFAELLCRMLRQKRPGAGQESTTMNAP